ncbi:MAG: hypothetical protein ACE5IT_02900 [bacterium]
MKKIKGIELALTLVVVIIGALAWAGSKNVEQRREEWMGKAEVIRDSVMYACCLEEPCWYCIKKSPKHGSGASCKCRMELMLGEEICGECLGEWIEGHGNPFFWNAFSEVYPDLAKLISKKYEGKIGYPMMGMRGECPMTGGGMMMRGFPYRSRFIEYLRDEWIKETDAIREEVKYECALEEDCLYCIQKSPKHGEGAQCTCKEDLKAGREICGACLGEWIEGHGESAYWTNFKEVYPKIAELIAEKYKEERR